MFPITDPTLIFFVVLCIILFAPIVMSRLRIPHIIGMVLAGVLIGQYGFNVLERDASFELFGRVGLLYIMFLAGLEMNITDIMQRRGQFLTFGLLTFFVPFFLSLIGGVYLLHYSPLVSVLLGCILGANTLIAYPIVCRYGLQKQQSVALGVGSSMIALTLSLLMLGAVVGASEGETDISFWGLFILKVAAFCAGSALVIPRLTRWFFSHYADSVMLYAYVLGILFLSAAISDLCGLEGIFGAFLAGLVLNRFIPTVSPLMNRIEFIGNAIFIPYFLIGVGMLINIRMLFHSLDTVWVALWMVAVGTIGKAIAAYVSCFIFKKSLLSGHMMFGLTEAHAAGGIAMTMVGMSLLGEDGLPLVDDNMLNGVVTMILFTCIISSIVVENSSQRILINERLSKEPEEKQGDDEKMLLPLQHTEDADYLVNLAIMMRNPKLNRGLVGINVVYDDKESHSNLSEGQRILKQAEATAISADVRMQTQSRLATNIANGIKHAFKEYDASEIIMGLHRMNHPQDSFWGAYTQGLIGDINRQISVCRILNPLTTVRLIQVAVPSRVEFEPGFYRWIERLARLASNLGCRILFHGRLEINGYISQYIKNRHPEVRMEFRHMEHWKELIDLGREVKDDHLLVVISARPGTVSYKPAFDKLPKELNEHFPFCNLMILYPDQNGLPQDVMTFTTTTHHETSAYATLRDWLKHISLK